MQVVRHSSQLSHIQANQKLDDGVGIGSDIPSLPNLVSS